MPAERVSMRRVREILRLKYECGRSDRAIAVAVGVARSTVQLCLARFAAAGLSWPLPATLTEQGLEALLFAAAGARAGQAAQGGAGLGGDPPGAAPPGRDAAAALGGIPGLHMPAVTATAVGASSTAAGKAGCRRPCDRCTRPASGCSSTTPGRRWRWWTAAPASCARRRCSSPCWARRTTPTPRRAGPRACRTGSARTCARWSSSAGCRGRSCRTTCAAACCGRTGMSRGSTRPTATWRRTTARRSCRRGCAGRATKPRSRPACWWWSAGSWRGCATSGSSRWPSSTRPSRRWSTDLNARPMRKLGVSRRQLFEQLDRPALSPLPSEPFVYAEWRIRRVGARLSRRRRRPLLLGAAPAAARAGRGPHHRPHRRAVPQGRACRRPCARRRCAAGTRRCAEHMPQAHRRHAEWTIERIGREAAAIGPATATLTTLILREPAAPGAGVPRLPRHPAAGAHLRPRSAGGGLRPRAGDRRPLLRLDPVDPAARPRPSAGAAPAAGAATNCRCCTRTSVAPATTIEENSPC